MSTHSLHVCNEYPTKYWLAIKAVLGDLASVTVNDVSRNLCWKMV